MLERVAQVALELDEVVLDLDGVMQAFGDEPAQACEVRQDCGAGAAGVGSAAAPPATRASIHSMTDW